MVGLEVKFAIPGYPVRGRLRRVILQSTREKKVTWTPLCQLSRFPLSRLPRSLVVIPIGGAHWLDQSIDFAQQYGFF